MAQQREGLSDELFKGVLDTIREATDIRLLLDLYNINYKTNREETKFRSICPIHPGADNPDSFLFKGDKKTYKCFSGGCHGDLFKFVMEMEKCTFWEAVKKLADINNIDTAHIDQRDIYRSKFERFLDEVGGFKEVIEKRKREFEVGANVYRDVEELKQFVPLPEYCSMKSRRDIDFFAQREFDVRFGRLSEDPYRHLRIIIPIHDEFGNYIAHLGRTWYSVKKAKYWYVPSGLAKNMFVFNLHRAKKHVRDMGDNIPTLFVCEGAFDVLKLWQMGYKNSVAIFGSEPTENQFKLVDAVVSRLILCFDNDEQGVKATKAMLNIATKLSSVSEILILPIPDEVNDVGEMSCDQIEESMMSLMAPNIWSKKAA